MATEFNPDAYLAKESTFNPDEFLGTAAQVVAPQEGSMPTVSVGNQDVPAGGTGPAFPERPTQPERSVGDYIEGGLETAATMATGAILGAPAYLAGAIPDAIDQLAGNPDRKYRESFAEAVTNTPESETGQAMVKSIGETLGVLPPVGLTGGVIPKFKMPNSPLGKKIAETGSERIKKNFTKKLGEDRFEPRIFNMVKTARKQGFDDGMTTMIANSPAVDKNKFGKMVKVMESVEGKPLEQQRYRPSDVAGDSLLQDVNLLRMENKKAGADLGDIAKNLKGEPVDVASPTQKFINDLEEMGVKFDGKGGLDFTDSLIEFSTPAKTLINNTLTKIKRNPQPDALQAHKFKKFLDEDLSHGKKQEGGVSGAVEKVLGDYRKGINEAIGDEYPLYKDANKRFSETITVLNELGDVVGKKLNMTGPNADKAFGVALRGLMNNTKGRANLITSVDNIQAASKSFKGRNQGDILAQMLFADELEVVFGGAGRTGLKSQVKQAGVDTALDLSQMSIPGALVVGAKAVNKRIKGVNRKNQLKAIKKLLSAK